MLKDLEGGVLDIGGLAKPTFQNYGVVGGWGLQLLAGHRNKWLEFGVPVLDPYMIDLMALGL